MKQIRLGLLAGFTALFFTACGGGSASADGLQSNIDSTQSVVVKFLDLVLPFEYGTQISLTYDETGNRLTKTSESQDNIHMYRGNAYVVNGSLKEYTYKYDFINNEVTETCINCEDSYAGNTTTYTFNNDGTIVKVRDKIFLAEDFYDEDGDLKTISYTIDYIDYNEVGIATYNKNRQQIRDSGSIIINEDSSLYSSYFFFPESYIRTYTYHENGRVAIHDETETYSDGTWERYISTFDENGNLLDTTYDSGTVWYEG